MQQRLGRYELVERIASGGQGTVWRARDTVLDRIVAIKVLNQSVADDPRFLEALQREARLAAGLNAAAGKSGVAVTVQRIGSMICTFFTDQPVHNLADAMLADRERFKKYFHGLLAEGVYFAPSPFEAGFISAAHTDEDIDATISAAEKVMATL